MLSGLSAIRPGQTVALTAGSRGIHQIGQILRAAVDFLRALGASPFIVPAMGSHGGGTADGQTQVLERLGITEQSCGCPIHSSMETVVVCQAAEGFPVHFDRLAYEADHVLVCNRVKPHTGFVGDIESGLMKMLLIGLGKHDGARSIIGRSRISTSARSSAVRRRKCFTGATFWAGWRSSKTPMIRPPDRGGEPAEFERREQHLLQFGQQWMPHLPFDGPRSAVD